MAAQPIEILLVEDNPADVRLAQETLKDYRMQNSLHVVTDGESALAFLRREGPYTDAPVPEMVMLDMTLPRMDGIEVLAAIRADGRLRHLPVVLLTSSEMDQKILRDLKVDTDCCILKPLTLESYLDAVRCFPNIGVSLVKIASA